MTGRIGQDIGDDGWGSVVAREFSICEALSISDTTEKDIKPGNGVRSNKARFVCVCAYVQMHRCIQGDENAHACTCIWRPKNRQGGGFSGSYS